MPVAKLPVIGPESAGILMTPEEFEAIDRFNENYRYELIHGVLVVSPLPSPLETGPNELLGFYLWEYKERHPNGHCLDDTLPQQYVRGRTGRRVADRLIWTGLGRLANVKTDVASIAVEFVSAGKRNRQRDYEDKKKEYQEAGIGEYWVFDRFERQLTVFLFRGKRVKEIVVSVEDEYESPLLPGFKVPVRELIEAAERRAEAESEE